MKYTDAVKLHSEDEVIAKHTGKVVTVLWVVHDKENREVYLHCDDGETYIHRAVR